MKPETRSRRCVAEALGTFVLVFVGTGAAVVDQLRGGALGVVGVGLVFGLAVLALVYALGHVSGAHLNPAVTAAFWRAGRLDGRDLLPYAASQCAGAIAASAALRLLFWGEASGLGATIPAGSPWQSLLLEFLLTAILMFVIMGVATDDRAQGQMAGIAVGAVVGLEAIFGGPVSGASMNPARSLGPAVITGELSTLWVYWLGPLAGAWAGASLYGRLRP